MTYRTAARRPRRVRLTDAGLSPDDPDTVVVQLNKRRPDLVDLFELDLVYAVFPVAPAPDGRRLWVGSVRGTDRTRLVRIDPTAGTSPDYATVAYDTTRMDEWGATPAMIGDEYPELQSVSRFYVGI